MPPQPAVSKLVNILKSGKSYHSIFHSFCVRPNLHFENQGEGEEVILVLRAHPITQIPWIINAIFLGFIVFVINFFLPQLFNAVQIIFFNVFTLAIILSYMWFNVLSWFFNVGIITNQRVVDVDYSAVIYHEITEAPLSRIQDITNKSGGFLESFIDFGDVFIQTAGTEANVEFLNIPHPNIVVRLINDLVHEIPV